MTKGKSTKSFLISNISKEFKTFLTELKRLTKVGTESKTFTSENAKSRPEKKKPS